jgi:hypothetical protein
VKAKLLGFAAQEVSDGETAVRDNDTNIQDYTSRLGQIDGQLRQIETRGVSLARQFLDESLARRNEIDLIRRNVETDEFQIRRVASMCVFMEHDHAGEEPGQFRAMCGGIRGDFWHRRQCRNLQLAHSPVLSGVRPPTSATIKELIT